MSAIKLSTPSSGSISLSPADTASNLTITVPAVTGTMLTNKTAGTVLQVVNATYATETSTTSTSYVDTGLTASITPTSATSKILVFVHQTSMNKQSAANSWLKLKLLRGSTDLKVIEAEALYSADTQRHNIGGTGITYLDSPATTSATTYKTQFASGTGDGVALQISSSTSSITLMEIAQ